MNLLVVSLVFFAVLASVHATEPNMAELKKFVLDNDAALQKIVDAYQAAGYYTMGNETRPALLRSNKYDVISFPADVPYSNLTNYQRSTHDRIIRYAKNVKFYFSIKTNAGHLSDDLKASALARATNKTLIHDLSTPTPADIIDTVRQTIHQEEGVLVNGHLEKSSEKLEALYAKLDKIPETAKFHNYWTNSKIIINLIQEYCTLQTSKCDARLLGAFHKFVHVHVTAEMNYTPINSLARVDRLLHDLPEHMKTLLNLVDVIKAEKLQCIFEGGCGKQKDDN